MFDNFGFGTKVHQGLKIQFRPQRAKANRAMSAKVTWTRVKLCSLRENTA